ncbi:uncharacterized protein LOC111330233 [Stylophora pistillata]|uniref:uncharacterized protein LOC111330233 n=1 Tax=Stylophora pistillata TaxID=50429 RepID=UPI000C04A082|nr:uncharacterized protein LOC111330233 [Stylophora pistillata]
MFPRAYHQPCDEDIKSLQSCQLLEECEEDFKSLKNYKESIEHVFSKYPDVNNYLERNLLPFPADWSGWYYPKKLITNNSTGKYTSLIPEQGQFHVALNAVEDSVITFNHFFDKLFSYLFGSLLPKRPRPYQSSLCVTAASLGWLKIPSDCYSNSKAKSWPKFDFPSYGIKAETKCFMLSYNLSKTLGKEPNPQVSCDLPDCNNNHYGGNFVRLACYHTFHVCCLSSDGCCSICKEPLEKLIKNKVSLFNEGLLKNGGTESDGESSDFETEDDTATVVNSETGNATAEQYYTSGLWEQKFNSSLSAIGEIDQPQHPNALPSYAHTLSQSSVVQTSSAVQQLSISPTKSNRITSWHFPPEYSQSALIG